jgi:hypothetical protein
MEADVDYDGETATIVTAWDTVIELKVGSADAVIDGEAYEMGGAPRLHGDAWFVPCRFVAEELGGFVSYDAERERIEIEMIE